MKLFQRIYFTRGTWTMLPLRLVLGAVFIAHGAQKLFGAFGGGGISGTADYFEKSLKLVPGELFAILAGCGEFFGGLLILIGFLTRFGALLTGATMAVAIAMVHNNAFFVGDNGMEFALTLLGASLALLIGGGGSLSIDRKLASALATKKD